MKLLYQLTQMDLDELRKLPEHIQDGLREYVEHGRPVGDFLRSVLANDLVLILPLLAAVLFGALLAPLGLLRGQPGDCWLMFSIGVALALFGGRR